MIDQRCTLAQAFLIICIAEELLWRIFRTTRCNSYDARRESSAVRWIRCRDDLFCTIGRSEVTMTDFFWRGEIYFAVVVEWCTFIFRLLYRIQHLLGFSCYILFSLKIDQRIKQQKKNTFIRVSWKKKLVNKNICHFCPYTSILPRVAQQTAAIIFLKFSHYSHIALPSHPSSSRNRSARPYFSLSLSVIPVCECLLLRPARARTRAYLTHIHTPRARAARSRCCSSALKTSHRSSYDCQLDGRT